MTRKVLTTTAMVALCSGLAMAGGPVWIKWELARQQASAMLKPIFVYATVNSKAEGC